MPKRTCTFASCTRDVRTKGLCHAHYNQASRGRALTPLKSRQTGTPAERFWLNVDKTDTCWHWTGTLGDDGYGRLSIDNKYTLAHRFAYTLLVGPIPDELVIDHECHNRDLSCPGGPCEHRRCVNPAHIIPRTIGQNVIRGARWRKHRQ
jgi:hypothetical protein